MPQAMTKPPMPITTAAGRQPVSPIPFATASTASPRTTMVNNPNRSGMCDCWTGACPARAYARGPATAALTASPTAHSAYRAGVGTSRDPNQSAAPSTNPAAFHQQNSRAAARRHPTSPYMPVSSRSSSP